ncbi:MAG: hypothetical protein HXX15_19120 [Rhodopseudomonas sp.]|uniref:hypothetical protein n=1 Tax=Rhodopseudomonas sp. TaxID=1078 RepID=UPI00185EDBEC|nr:hypothetical protein [Rhodopseudomonas sp.]NVN88198.1 hypothetical protein [Rhodopseudomonas sp.]
MATCMRCRADFRKPNVEAIDGLYEIHTLSCDNCGFEARMALRAIDPIAQCSLFRIMMEPAAKRQPQRAAAA